jgi:hypothetical protein
MGIRIKTGFLLIALSFFVLVGCGNEPNSDAEKAIEAVVEREQENGYEYTETDFSFKIYYSELLDVYMLHAFIPYEGEESRFERLYSYTVGNLERHREIRDLPRILTEGDYLEVYRSGKFDE